MTREGKVDEDVEWTYSRPEGDIVVRAPTAELAIEIMKNHGFLYIDPKRLQQSIDPKREGIS